jgi:hypothetical protein
MEAGQIAEFDGPLELFDRPDSIFRSMCDAAKLTREAIVRIRAGEDATTFVEDDAEEVVVIRQDEEPAVGFEMPQVTAEEKRED